MKLHALLLLTAVLILVAGMASAQDMTLELGDTSALKTCDHVHAIDGESKCTTYHVEIKETPAESVSTLYLDGEPYAIQWMRTGYYLTSGRIVHADGNPLPGAPVGLTEVRPLSGAAFQAQWHDANGDGQMSLGDTIQVNGRTERIVDTRLNIRVSPLR